MRSNKRYAKAAMGLMLAASMALPYAAGAQGAENRPEETGFCRALPMMTLKVEERLDAGSGKIGTKRTDADARLESLKKEHEDKLKELRAKEDTKRAERLGKLEGEAESDTQRQALQKFQTDVASAVDARRAMTDAANEEFRNGVKRLVAERKAAVDAATSSFAIAVRAALAKAKTDCASGVLPAKARQTLLDALQAARAALQTELQEAAKIGPQVQPLIETRRAAHQKAMDAFHAALEASKAELKMAFGA